MDFFDERILAELRDGEPRTFATILAQVGFSHNTLQHHLERLTAKGLVIRQKTSANDFGRPKFTYHIPSRTKKQVTRAVEDPTVELIAIAFKQLRHVCSSRREATAKKQGRTACLKSAPKSKNKTYHHFTPISEQPCALQQIRSTSTSSFQTEQREIMEE
jgi:predicted ArsR family transcriptional regulator